MATVLDKEHGRELVAKAFGLLKHHRIDDVVFIAVDTEWGSYFPSKHPTHNQISEVGLAFLDTHDIASTKPGTNGHDWISNIRAIHYLVSDTVGLKSDRLDARGMALHAAEHFEFGTTTLIDRDKLADALSHDFRIPDVNLAETRRRFRRVVVVGQDWNEGDVKSLKAVGFDLELLDNIVAIVDTQQLQWNDSSMLRPGLSRLLREFSCVPLHLHNGANDAVYALSVLVFGALWRHAWSYQQAGNWDPMNSTFPGMRINGEEAIIVLKEAIAREMGGRCHSCTRYGHVANDCSHMLVENEKAKAVNSVVESIGDLGKPWIDTARSLETLVDGPVVLNLRIPHRSADGT